MRSSGPSKAGARRGGQIPAELDPGHPQTSLDGFLEELRHRRKERELKLTPTPKVCPLCKGRGWRIIPDGGAGQAVQCECRKEAQADRLVAAAKIPEKYQTRRLYNFIVKHPDPDTATVLARAQALCERYTDEFWDAKKGPRSTGLLLTGPPGTGKTHLAVGTLLEIIHRYHIHGYFVDFTSLLKSIQMTWDDPTASSLAEITRPVLEAKLLVLDELGAQKPTDWVMQNLYWIINTRYSRGLATIFTSNYRLATADAPAEPALAMQPSPYDVLDGRGVMEPLPTLAANRPEMLTQRITAPLVSRLYEMSQIISLSAVARDYDYRQRSTAAKRPRGK